MIKRKELQEETLHCRMAQIDFRNERNFGDHLFNLITTSKAELGKSKRAALLFMSNVFPLYKKL